MGKHLPAMEIYARVAIRGAAGLGAALSRSDPLGVPLPIASGEGRETMPDARRRQE